MSAGLFAFSCALGQSQSLFSLSLVGGQILQQTAAKSREGDMTRRPAINFVNFRLGRGLWPNMDIWHLAPHILVAALTEMRITKLDRHAPFKLSNVRSGPMRNWTIQSARNRFGELVRSACDEGPQMLTRRGKETAVVLSAEAYRNLTRQEPQGSLVEFLRNSPLAGLPEELFERDRDPGREIDL